MENVFLSNIFVVILWSNFTQPKNWTSLLENLIIIKFYFSVHVLGKLHFHNYKYWIKINQYFSQNMFAFPKTFQFQLKFMIIEKKYFFESSRNTGHKNQFSILVYYKNRKEAIEPKLFLLFVLEMKLSLVCYHNSSCLCLFITLAFYLCILSDFKIYH